MKHIINISIIAAVVMTAIFFSANTYAGNDKKQLISQEVTELVESICNDSKEINASTPVIDRSYNNDDHFSESQYYEYRKSVSDNMIAIIAIIFGVLTPFLSIVAIVFIALLFAHKKRKLRYHTIELAISNGRDLPDSFYESFDNKNGRSRLQSALVWIAWGIGIALFLLCVDDIESAFIAAIPLLVGAAKLITYFIEDRPKKVKEDAE